MFVVIVGINGWVSKIYTKVQEMQMSIKDARLKMLTEVLNGMRVKELQYKK